MHAANSQSQRRSHTMGTEKRFENHPLIGGDEPVEGLGILASVMMRMQLHLGADLAEISSGRGGDNDPISDTGYLDEHLSRCPTLKQNAAN